MAKKRESNGGKPISMNDFNEINKLIASFLEEVAKNFSEFTEQGIINGPLVYGFNMRIGPNGEPVIGSFGNIRPSEPKVKFTEEREPLVDVIDSGDNVTVIAEMPGVDKKDIKVSIMPNDLSIDAKDHGRNYSKKIRLTSAIEQSPESAAFRNGVLELTFRKARVIGKQPKPFTVRITEK